jgi:starch phosphorylase
MNILGRMTVSTALPEPLTPLADLAQNLYWTWTPEVRALFRTLDEGLWERTGHNPILVLRNVPQDRINALAADASFVDSVRRAHARFQAYLERPSADVVADGDTYAYFCAEYGWHEGVALYSGGLGVLAGDHTKAASDLGLPLVAVGLWYSEGYFHQRIAADGTQEAIYERKQPGDLPMQLATAADGSIATVTVTAFGQPMVVRAWVLHAGRTPVYLLDVDHDGNPADVREVTRRLYGGDQRTRILQEMLLGIGGVRMLRQLGIAPTAWHMNEGHSAFMALERAREHVAGGASFEAAQVAVQASTTFTVHTPVAAGNDAFPFELVDEAFEGWPERLGVDASGFHDWGRADHGWGPVFSMPALAIRSSSKRNGVSELHGHTSRGIWRDLWPSLPQADVPIQHVTNGVHAATWMSPEIQDLAHRHLGDDAMERIDDAHTWSAMEHVDPTELWAVRRELKARSVRFLRRRLVRQLHRQRASQAAMHAGEELFNSDVLTIGFARRFATYKRATLIFRDVERLKRILNNPDRPVQLVFAGKAHPADHAGQQLIQTIDAISHDPEVAGKIVFAEDYDMAVGRALTRGVDVWLNTPRRPLEASGTSGQKAAMNGVLNLSILDGWWPEGFDQHNGWAFGSTHAGATPDQRDERDADALYDLLEHEVAPLYYDRNAAGVPVEWMTRAAHAIASVAPVFNARRMVHDYATWAYRPTSEQGARVTGTSLNEAERLAAAYQHVEAHWGGAQLHVDADASANLAVGEGLQVEATLTGVDPNVPVVVQAVFSPESDALEDNLRVIHLEPAQADGATRTFKGVISPPTGGQYAFGVRAFPQLEGHWNPLELPFVVWAGEPAAQPEAAVNAV